MLLGFSVYPGLCSLVLIGRRTVISHQRKVFNVPELRNTLCSRLRNLRTLDDSPERGHVRDTRKEASCSGSPLSGTIVCDSPISNLTSQHFPPTRREQFSVVSDVLPRVVHFLWEVSSPGFCVPLALKSERYKANPNPLLPS